MEGSNPRNKESVLALPQDIPICLCTPYLELRLVVGATCVKVQQTRESLATCKVSPDEKLAQVFPPPFEQHTTIIICGKLPSAELNRRHRLRVSYPRPGGWYTRIEIASKTLLCNRLVNIPKINVTSHNSDTRGSPFSSDHSHRMRTEVLILFQIP